MIFPTVKCSASDCNVCFCDFSFHSNLTARDPGSQGSLCLIKDSTERLYILKSMAKRRIGASEELTNFLSPIDSDFVVHYLHCFEHESTISFIMDYYEAGSLSGFISSQRSKNLSFRLADSDVLSIFVQVMSAIRSIHTLNRIHCDLKQSNILLTSKNFPLRIKLCDFGVSVSSVGSTSSPRGTPGYMAPEMHNNEPFGFPVDYFSLGVILYELTEGRQPFPVKCSVFTDFTAPLIISESNFLANIIRGLLDLNPVTRFDFKTLIAIPKIRKAYEKHVGPVVDCHCYNELTSVKRVADRQVRMIRQLTESNRELKSQVYSLSNQLMLLHSEFACLKDSLADLTSFSSRSGEVEHKSWCKVQQDCVYSDCATKNNNVVQGNYFVEPRQVHSIDRSLYSDSSQIEDVNSFCTNPVHSSQILECDNVCKQEDVAPIRTKIDQQFVCCENDEIISEVSFLNQHNQVEQCDGHDKFTSCDSPNSPNPNPLSSDHSGLLHSNEQSFDTFTLNAFKDERLQTIVKQFLSKSKTKNLKEIRVLSTVPHTISSIKGIELLSNLEELCLWVNTSETTIDLDPLLQLSNLSKISFRNFSPHGFKNSLSSLKFLNQNLKKFNLYSTDYDVGFLSMFTNLEVLKLYQHCDLSSLSTLSMLKELHLVSGFDEAFCLTRLVSLSHVTVDSSLLSKLPVLEQISSLELVSTNNVQVVLERIVGFKNLSTLVLSHRSGKSKYFCHCSLVCINSLVLNHVSCTNFAILRSFPSLKSLEVSGQNHEEFNLSLIESPINLKILKLLNLSLSGLFLLSNFSQLERLEIVNCIEKRSRKVISDCSVLPQIGNFAVKISSFLS
ncbi:hypothetical protein RCL1_008792 [Eukaryota sp. TZLM3-RCL]